MSGFYQNRSRVEISGPRELDVNVKHVQNLKRGSREAHDFALDGHEDRARGRRRKTHYHIVG